MIKKIKVTVLIILTCGTLLSGQQLSHQVLVPAAGLATAGVISYSQTVGETAVEIMDGSGYILTQGFHQPGITLVAETPPEGTGVDVYPNPATDVLYVKLFGEDARKIRIEIINITGYVASTVNLEFSSKYYTVQQLDVSGLKYGLYFVRITSSDSVIARIFKIEKM